MNTIEESFSDMLKTERLDGYDQSFCGKCERKIDAFKGFKIQKYPPILMLCLSRFELDYDVLDRVKINAKIAFGLELDISSFTEKTDAFASEDEKIYELCAVFIHRGSAHARHHFVYLRDVLREEDWKELSGDKADDKTGEEKESDVFKEGKGAINTTGKKANVDEEAKEYKQGNEKLKPDAENDVFAEVEFPYPFKNQELRYGWFEFNDTKVKPITISEIAKQLGGRPENAYMLTYRQRALNKNLQLQKMVLPEYLQKEIEAKNSALESERVAYSEAASSIECFFFESSDVDIEKNTFRGGFHAHSGKKIIMKFDMKIGKLLPQVSKAFPELNLKAEEMLIVEITVLIDKSLAYKREINNDLSVQQYRIYTLSYHAFEKELTVKEAAIDHHSGFLVISNKSESTYKAIASQIGVAFTQNQSSI